MNSISSLVISSSSYCKTLLSSSYSKCRCSKLSGRKQDQYVVSVKTTFIDIVPVRAEVKRSKSCHQIESEYGLLNFTAIEEYCKTLKYNIPQLYPVNAQETMNVKKQEITTVGKQSEVKHVVSIKNSFIDIAPVRVEVERSKSCHQVNYSSKHEIAKVEKQSEVKQDTKFESFTNNLKSNIQSITETKNL